MTPRERAQTPAQLDEGDTRLPLWDAAQRELRATGTLRKRWGKRLILMTPTYEDAFQTLLRLNARYALDAGDPCGYAGALRCFGRYDRSFVPSPVWGTIRAMTKEKVDWRTRSHS
jgi:deoxyribodipyrimidine photo-lyase